MVNKRTVLWLAALLALAGLVIGGDGPAAGAAGMDALAPGPRALPALIKCANVGTALVAVQSRHEACPYRILLAGKKSPSATVLPVPDLPTIVTELDLGLPAGNGYSPQRLALDSQGRRLYTLNAGLASVDSGPTVSVVDLDAGQVTALVRLGDGPAEDLFSMRPLALHLDPYRPRLYAIWGDPFDEPTTSRLSVIDTGSLAVLLTLPGVAAVAPGPDRLYLAADSRLWAVDPDSFQEQASRAIEPPARPLYLLLDPAANRLVLGQVRPANLLFYAADSLAPLNSLAAGERLIAASLDGPGRRLLVVASQGQQVALQALDLEGRPVPGLEAVVLSTDVYGDAPLAAAGEHLAVIGRSAAGADHVLFVLDRATLAPTLSLPVPPYPQDLAFDPDDGRFYLAYNSSDSFLLAIDPVSGAAAKIYTALTLLDALADPAAGRLYLVDNRETIRVLNLSDYTNIADAATAPAGYNCYDLPGCLPPKSYIDLRLALDPARQRLYLSADPVRFLDTATLAVTRVPNLAGQVTPDPAGDRLYLTPPCRCRTEVCNTFVLDAETLTGALALFPPADPLVAECVYATSLDPANQLLFTQISNGVPGSNSGSFFAVFDVAGPPRRVYTAPDISYGQPALDPANRRAFIPRYRMGQTFLNRFDVRDGDVSQALEVAGAGGQTVYDPANQRLFVVAGDMLRLFDDELALLAELPLPGNFNPFTFDPAAQRLYLGGPAGNLLVIAASGGQLPPPRPAPPLAEAAGIAPARLAVAPNGDRFRIFNQRLYRAAPGSEDWQLLGQGLPPYPVSALAISPGYAGDRTLLAGLAAFGQGGGLYRSTDGGDTWYPAARGLTDLDIQQIAFSPTFTLDRTVFVITASRGLFRSTDGGDSWTSLAGNYSDDPRSPQISYLGLSPDFASDGLLLAGRDNLLRSTDGGDTWTDTGLPAGLIAFSPQFSRDGLILNDGRWRSVDGGRSWQPAAAGLAPARHALQLFFSPAYAADRTVYILLDQGYQVPPLLQRSTDAGQSWEALLAGLPDGFYPAAAAALPGGELYLAAPSGQSVAARPEALAWGPAPVDINQLDPHDLAAGPDGVLFMINSAAGLFRSTDGGRSWQETGFPIRAGEDRRGRLAVAGNGVVFAAAGRAIARSDDLGQQWSYLPGLPAGFEVASLAVSPAFAADGLLLAGGAYNSNRIQRSADGGRTWQTVFDAANLEQAADISLVVFSPTFAGDGLVYAWLQEVGLLRSTDRGLTWQVVGSGQDRRFAQSMLVSPDGGRLYLGLLYGGLLVSDDAGQTWQPLDETIPGERAWSSALALQEPAGLWLGTDVGVFYSPDGGQTWQPASDGLPLAPGGDSPAQVRALARSGDRLYAALAGGGLYVLPPGRAAWQPAGAAPLPIEIEPAPAPPTPALPTPPPLAPAPSPTPPFSPEACPDRPARFEELWASRVVQLGCPAGALQQGLMAEQPFEGGLMFWRSSPGLIYALPTGQPYRWFEDTWDPGQPAYTCPDLGPSQTPPTPQRGFGKVWCSQADLRQLLGNAAGEERPFDAAWQEFEHGLIFSTDRGTTYILAGQSYNWERID